MDYVAILEHTHHLDDRIGLPDIREKLVAESLPNACALHKTGDIHEFKHRGNGLRALAELGEFPEAGIRHLHHADVRFDRTERIVAYIHGFPGQRLE